MEVYWLEQSQADVPAHNDWLSANEVVCLNAMRFAKRRVDWRLGRWTAKHALSIYLDVPSRLQVFKKMELRPAPSGAPEAFFDDQPAAVTISLSHRAGIAACAVAVAGAELGCDLEIIEPRSDAFVADYFTLEEQELFARVSVADRTRNLALLWSGKESALKALHEGLRLDARSVVVRPSDAAPDLHGWSPMQVRQTDRRTFHGWWQHEDSIVRTLVAAPPPDPPIRLRIPEYAPAAASRCA
ncbi:MAG: 4'-phosphopantetheinyl transferase superfamily protein [Candidatus Acidiferrum sp.]